MESGGLTYDATGAENFTSIIAIAPSPINENVIWVGTDDGNLQLTQDGGKTWNNMIDRIKDVPTGSWIPQITASEYNESEAFVVINDYRRDNWAPYVYHTTDFGKKWKNLVSSEKVTGYALSFVQDPVANNLYFVGTESGLYFSIDAGENWTKWTHEYPTVSTMDLKIHPRENDLIIGTFGRAAWIIDNIQPLRELAKQGESLFEKSAYLFPIPEAEMAMFSQPPGYHFPADAAYSGENKQQGAMISFIANPSDDKKDKAKLEIFDAAQNLVNTLEIQTKKGINRLYWTFDKKRVRYPNQAKPKKEDEPVYEGQVLPENYKVKLSYNGTSDSTTLNIIFDHRIKYDKAFMNERNELVIKFDKEVLKATKAADKIRDAQVISAQIGDLISEMEGEEYKELKDLHKSINKKLTTFSESLNPKPVQGIFRDQNSMTSLLRGASRAISSSIDKPGLREEIAIGKAQKSMATFVNEVNIFFDGDWANYQKLILEKDINFFTNFK
jgi:hypothetical protein